MKYCYEDEELDQVAKNMAQVKVPVLSREKRLVGIIALGDIALAQGGERAAGKAVAGVSRAGDPKSQTG